MRAEPDPMREPPVTIRKRPAVAAGLPAIYQTVRCSLREMGAARAFKTLLSVNKKKGFDCQSSEGRGVLREWRESHCRRGDDKALNRRIFPAAFVG
jgi:hypothetical protein